MLQHRDRTALHEAVRACSEECVKVLIEAGADVEAEDVVSAASLRPSSRSLAGVRWTSAIAHHSGRLRL